MTHDFGPDAPYKVAPFRSAYAVYDASGTDLFFSVLLSECEEWAFEKNLLHFGPAILAENARLREAVSELRHALSHTAGILHEIDNDGELTRLEQEVLKAAKATLAKHAK